VLFDETPHGLRSLLGLDEAGKPLPVFNLYGRLRLQQRSRHRVVSSPNVVGLLKGSDPQKAHEYVLYTAHLDHLGEVPPRAGGAKPGDRIYNGALDNAVGVAVMLETARLFTQARAPRRSLLFVAVTAEEKGLVGSDYFANNPPVPAADIVADINIDMPVLLYDFGDVIAYGSEHSSLGRAVAQAAREAGVALTPDPFPERNLFIRSDHYSFVQQGIPSVFLVTGFSNRGAATDSRAVFERFLREHYHQPSDQPDLPLDYAAGARFTRINKRVGEIIANQAERPRWRQDDVFGRIQRR
jgi:Zn-dependent M28 family amino/carboxypeptidase